MSATHDKVGFIGLGQIGAPMAERLLEHPGGLVVCDVVAAAMAPFAARGAQTATDPAEVVSQGATVISVMVRDDAQVRDVVGRVVETASAGTVVAIHSTIRPETAEDLALVAARSDVAVLDAPVSCGFMGAATGRLAVLLGGGDEAAVERCRVAFSAFADRVAHFGPAGGADGGAPAAALLTRTCSGHQMAQI